MGKYIDAEKLIANLERQNVDKKVIEPVIRIIDSLQQEQREMDLEKEAFVDNYVVDDGRIELEGMPLPCLNPIILLPYPQFKPGDKVRIVVLKAEEE